MSEQDDRQRQAFLLKNKKMLESWREDYETKWFHSDSLQEKSKLEHSIKGVDSKLEPINTELTEIEGKLPDDGQHQARKEAAQQRLVKLQGWHVTYKKQLDFTTDPVDAERLKDSLEHVTRQIADAQVELDDLDTKR